MRNYDKVKLRKPILAQALGLGIGASITIQGFTAMAYKCYYWDVTTDVPPYSACGSVCFNVMKYTAANGYQSVHRGCVTAGSHDINHDCDPNGSYQIVFDARCGFPAYTNGPLVASSTNTTAPQTVYHQATGTGTTAYSTPLSLVNNSPFSENFAIYDNGVFTGTVVVVNGNSTVSTTISSSGPSDVLTYQQTGDGASWNASGFTPVNGGAIFTGVTGNLGTSPFGSGDLAGGQQSGTITNAGSTNTVGTVTPNSNTNAVLSYGSNSVATNAANNGTLQTGFNGVYTAVVQGDQGVIDAINALHTDVNKGNNGISNTIGVSANTISNAINGEKSALSNLLSQIQTNTANTAFAASNAYGTGSNQLYNQTNAANLLSSQFSTNLSYWTNQGAGYGQAVANSWKSTFGDLPTNANSSTPDSGDLSIAVGHGLPNVVLGMSHLPAGFTLFTAAIAWVIWLGTTYAMMSYGQKLFDKLWGQQQMSGSQQELFGSNFDAVSGYAYAVIFASILANFPTLISSYIHSASGSAGTTGLSAVSSSPVWGWLISVSPADTIVTAFFAYIGFRFFYGYPLLCAVRMIIVFMIR